MKLFVFWLFTSVLWALETTQMGTSSSDLDLCQEDEPTLHRYKTSASGQTRLVADEEAADDEEVSCFLYPEKKLRCTMPTQYLPSGSQLSASLIVSDGEKKTSILLESSSEAIRPSEEPGEARPVAVYQLDGDFSSLIVLLNVSGRDTLSVYCQKFRFELLEVLSPPPNISVDVVKKGLVVVRWGLPYSRSSKEPSCFNYLLDVNQQVNKEVIKGRNNLEMVVDPAAVYTVRMRTRKSPNCLGSTEWSAWSDAIAVPPRSLTKLNYVVIVSILLGTPMIILALLLLFRRPSVSKFLFPQIPQPSMKYKLFLQRHTSFHCLPVVQTAYEENVTVVEDTQR